MSKLQYQMTDGVARTFTTGELDECVAVFTRSPRIALTTRWSGRSGLLWECNRGGHLLWFFLYEVNDRAFCEVRFPGEYGRKFLIAHMDQLEQQMRERASRRGTRAPHRRSHRRGKGN